MLMAPKDRILSKDISANGPIPKSGISPVLSYARHHPGGFSAGGMPMPQHMAMGGLPPMSEVAPWYVKREANEADSMHPGGLLGGNTGGRTDVLPLSVPAGSYVVPADVVSGMGEGNTNAGANVLDKMMHTLPHGIQGGGGRKGGMGIPRPPRPPTTGSPVNLNQINRGGVIKKYMEGGGSDDLDGGEIPGPSYHQFGGDYPSFQPSGESPDTLGPSNYPNYNGPDENQHGYYGYSTQQNIPSSYRDIDPRSELAIRRVVRDNPTLEDNLETSYKSIDKKGSKVISPDSYSNDKVSTYRQRLANDRNRGGIPHGKGSVPIIAASGEYIVRPEHVKIIGNGSISHGHRILDSFVLKVRKKNIEDTKKLKPPKK